MTVCEAGIVWDAYDNFHGHDDFWGIWGLLRTARHRYTPKKRYYAARQVYRFVPSGSRRVGRGFLAKIGAYRCQPSAPTTVG